MLQEVFALAVTNFGHRYIPDDVIPQPLWMILLPVAIFNLFHKPFLPTSQ